MLKLTEDEARGFDAICKGIGITALILGGAWTLAQYFFHRAEERETAAIEARKPFLEKRLQTYADIVLATATIVNSDNPKEVEEAKKRFLILNLGPLTLVEDREVRDATAIFRKCLEESAKCDKATLAAHAETVAASCRKSVGEGWGVRFPHPITGLAVDTR